MQQYKVIQWNVSFLSTIKHKMSNIPSIPSQLRLQNLCCAQGISRNPCLAARHQNKTNIGQESLNIYIYTYFFVSYKRISPHWYFFNLSSISCVSGPKFSAQGQTNLLKKSEVNKCVLPLSAHSAVLQTWTVPDLVHVANCIQAQDSQRRQHLWWEIKSICFDHTNGNWLLNHLELPCAHPIQAHPIQDMHPFMALNPLTHGSIFLWHLDELGGSNLFEFDHFESISNQSTTATHWLSTSCILNLARSGKCETYIRDLRIATPGAPVLKPHDFGVRDLYDACKSIVTIGQLEQHHLVSYYKGARLAIQIQRIGMSTR